MTGTTSFGVLSNQHPWSQWTSDHSAQALTEGWDMFWCDFDSESGLEIEAVDEDGRFANDDEAIRHVELCAIGGSELHQLAMQLERSWLHGQGHAYWELPVWRDHYGKYLETVR